jgi:hypothetical protein
LVKGADVTDGGTITVATLQPVETALINRCAGKAAAAGVSRVTGINGRAAGKERVGLGRATIVTEAGRVERLGRRCCRSGRRR